MTVINIEEIGPKFLNIEVVLDEKSVLKKINRYLVSMVVAQLVFNFAVLLHMWGSI